METPEKNMVNAGIIFMFTAWLQGQMSDLIIFKNNTNLISDFVKNPTRVPPEFHSIRVSYWEKQFGSVKNKSRKLSRIFLQMMRKETLRSFTTSEIWLHMLMFPLVEAICFIARSVESEGSKN
ncbi:MAG: hypothetical protein RIK85_17855 [Marinobacter sp.]